mmetsp:Transcript_26209/g.62579  ORF Transcript_26209/g.62579 Transcript_26209/m.62579 type:complete len:345 (-) Transcript_26209:61-1095(-)
MAEKASKQTLTFLRAAEAGDEAKLKAEIEAKETDLNVRDDGNNTALHLSSYRGHTESVRILLKAGADPSLGNENRDQPLHLAALANRLETIKVLTAEGSAWHSKISIEAEDAQGYCALHYACGEGHEQVARFLYTECKASLQSRNKDGLTPLMCAVQQGHATIVGSLVEFCPENVKETNKCGDSALHYATISESGVAMLRLLLKAGADPTLKNAEGNTALHEAKVEKQHECATLLDQITGALTAAHIDTTDPVARQKVVNQVLSGGAVVSASSPGISRTLADNIDGAPPPSSRRQKSRFSSERAGMRVKTSIELAKEERQQAAAQPAKPKPKSRIFSAGSNPVF